MPANQFLSCNLSDVLVGEPLPTDLYIYLNFKFLTFRAAGDVLDRLTFERLEVKGVQNLFFVEERKPEFEAWVAKSRAEESTSAKAQSPEMAKARDDAKREVFDLFHSENSNQAVVKVLSTSKVLVSEVMKFPYAVNSLAQLQSYSRSAADHSVNVSTLSVYLAMQLGYSHKLILQHVGAGALMHDIGKTQIVISEDDPPELADKKMREHPVFGVNILKGMGNVPNEVQMIVAHHHEFFDGTGYPQGLRGSSIYDLARIVAIANTFDELVSDASGSLVERQRSAVQQLEVKYMNKFEPQKFEKALKILKMGV